MSSRLALSCSCSRSRAAVSSCRSCSVLMVFTSAQLSVSSAGGVLTGTLQKSSTLMASVCLSAFCFVLGPNRVVLVVRVLLLLAGWLVAVALWLPPELLQR